LFAELEDWQTLPAIFTANAQDARLSQAIRRNHPMIHHQRRMSPQVVAVADASLPSLDASVFVVSLASA
jgi:hypothetical protein